MNTITKSTTTASNPISELIAKVMDKYDTNKDQKLNADEFGSFLTGLLDGAATGTDMTSAVEDTTETDAPTATPAATKFNPSPCNFGVMHGFAATNYYSAEVNTMKYQFARIAADYDPKQPGALERVVADPRFKAAFPNAQLVGHDGIDFGGQLSEGDGSGVPVFRVDVGESFLDNRSGNAWQWLDLVNA